MKYGIIVATSQELEEISKLLKETKKLSYYELNFYEGIIGKNNVIIVKCGIGKVNAARVAQILIDRFNVDKIINIGAAGSINPKLNIKDIVIGDRLVQYDFDTSSIGNNEKGEIDGVGKFFKCDKTLINTCKRVLEEKNDRDYNYKIGTIATADTFCSDPKKAIQIREEFGAECVEMEGAAIAQVCYLDKIPFLVIRGISDSPNGNNGIEYFQYCNIAAKQASKLIEKILLEE